MWERACSRLAFRSNKDPGSVINPKPNPFPTQPFPIMGNPEVLLRPLGHDPVGVDGLVAGVVMALDMSEVHSLGNPRPLVQLQQPVRQVRTVSRSEKSRVGKECVN